MMTTLSPDGTEKVSEHQSPRGRRVILFLSKGPPAIFGAGPLSFFVQDTIEDSINAIPQ